MEQPARRVVFTHEPVDLNTRSSLHPARIRADDDIPDRKAWPPTLSGLQSSIVEVSHREVAEHQLYHTGDQSPAGFVEGPIAGGLLS
jgi:hypothetical protein